MSSRILDIGLRYLSSNISVPFFIQIELIEAFYVLMSIGLLSFYMGYAKLVTFLVKNQPTTLKEMLMSTANLNGKKLSTDSSRDSDAILDTRNPY